jgi:DNA-binding transcriptional MerR regulator
MSAQAAAGSRQAADDGLLRISELADASGVPVATIRHYLREGLLPEPVRTSRNMAYYPPEFVDRIRLIKQLQEERFMPLRVIRDLLAREDTDPERLRAMIELEDRILERALAGERERIPADEVRRRYAVPAEVLERLAELGVLSPYEGGYSPSDVRIIEAISRFRAGGYDESLGFTVYDTLRYTRALEPLVAEEVQVLTERLTGDLTPAPVDRATPRSLRPGRRREPRPGGPRSGPRRRAWRRPRGGWGWRRCAPRSRRGRAPRA